MSGVRLTQTEAAMIAHALNTAHNYFYSHDLSNAALHAQDTMTSPLTQLVTRAAQAMDTATIRAGDDNL